MNNKGNWFFKGLFVLLIGAVWTFGIAPAIQPVIMNYILDNQAKGITAFLLANINFIFYIFLLLFLTGWTILDP